MSTLPPKTPDSIQEVEKSFAVDWDIKGGLINNICTRELHFFNRYLQGGGVSHGPYYGWTISKNEFENIKKLVELKPKVDEYNRLLNYERN